MLTGCIYHRLDCCSRNTKIKATNTAIGGFTGGIVAAVVFIIFKSAFENRDTRLITFLMFALAGSYLGYKYGERKTQETPPVVIPRLNENTMETTTETYYQETDDQEDEAEEENANNFRRLTLGPRPES